MTPEQPRFARIETLPPTEAEALVDAIMEGDLSSTVRVHVDACAGSPNASVWLLAHCVTGVTWGVARAGRMALSAGKAAAYPNPLPRSDVVLQLRFFGEGGELLVWRDESKPGAFLARFLTEEGENVNDEDPFRPQDDLYLLGTSSFVPGASVDSGFAVLRDRSGRSQVCPHEPGGPAAVGGSLVLGLDVRHFFAEVPDSGAVRIAASRLVGLRRLGPDERVVA